jgi:hypothetical protein
MEQMEMQHSGRRATQFSDKARRAFFLYLAGRYGPALFDLDLSYTLRHDSITGSADL